MTVSELIAGLSEYDGDTEVQAVIQHRLLFRLLLSLQEVAPVIDMNTNKALPSLSLAPQCEEGWYNIIKRNEMLRREEAGLLPPTDLNLCLDNELRKSLEQVLAEIGLDTKTAFHIFAKKVVRERRIPFDISL